VCHLCSKTSWYRAYPTAKEMFSEMNRWLGSGCRKCTALVGLGRPTRTNRGGPCDWSAALPATCIAISIVGVGLPCRCSSLKSCMTLPQSQAPVQHQKQKCFHWNFIPRCHSRRLESTFVRLPFGSAQHDMHRQLHLICGQVQELGQVHPSVKHSSVGK